jgi:hypothetical protein
VASDAHQSSEWVNNKLQNERQVHLLQKGFVSFNKITESCVILLHDINFLNFTRHLSEHLVAAFAKRLARLTLVAPPQDIHIILMFIGNLVLRHPGLKRLFNHPTGGEGKS